MSCVIAYSCCVCSFFFFKQKTAYEMRISDWSSDVCSSDLSAALALSSIPQSGTLAGVRVGHADGDFIINPTFEQRKRSTLDLIVAGKIGRASCRERVCQYV